MARLFINLGERSDVNKSDILNAFSENGMKSGRIGDVEVYSRFSFIEVPKGEANTIIDKMSHSQEIKGKKMILEFANDPLA